MLQEPAFVAYGAPALFALAVQAIAAPLITRYITGRVEASATKHVQKELEEHRHLLTKRFEDFSLFTAKKHEVYAELFQHLAEAEGSVAGLSGGQYGPNYEDYTRKDAEEYLETQRIAGEISNSILQIWDSDRKQAARKLSEAVRLVAKNLADLKVMEARNYLMTKALYLSDRVDGAADALLKNLRHNFAHAIMPDETSGKAQLRLKEEAVKMLSELKQVMSEELRSGVPEPGA